MFADKLKLLRKQHQITQVDFAEIFHISQGTVGNWESGNREPSFDTIKQIADYFQVTTDYLLDFDEQKKSTPTTETSEVEADAVKLYRALLSSGLLKEGQDLTRKQIDGLANIAGLISAMFDD